MESSSTVVFKVHLRNQPYGTCPSYAAPQLVSIESDATIVSLSC